jgi:hypothetical protein
MGIFSGSGVGKSVLMGMMARNTAADVSVIGLIGERGREVREFIENDLGEEGLRRSVVVVATSDQPPLIRIRGAFADALCDGSEGGGTCRRRASHDERLHPFCFLNPAAALGKGWDNVITREHYRSLHGLGRRR